MQTEETGRKSVKRVKISEKQMRKGNNNAKSIAIKIDKATIAFIRVWCTGKKDIHIFTEDWELITVSDSEIENYKTVYQYKEV